MTSLLLDSMIIVPALGSIVCWLLGRTSGLAAARVAAVAILTQGVLVAALTPAVVSQGVVMGASGQGFALWSLLADGLSLPLVMLTVITGLLAVSSSWRTVERGGAHFGLILLVQSAVTAVFLAADIVMFYIAWEAVLIPMFLLIGGWGSSDARRAAMKFLVYTFAGGAVLLVGVIYVASLSGSTIISDLSAASGVESLAFWLLAIGFLVKVPAVPFHTWLPDAHTEAPTAGSILLAGVLLKMGGYGLIRIALPVAPGGFAQAGPVLIGLGVIGIVWGAAAALVQTDLKRLVAYSSVSHMGFVLIAIGVATPESLSAALLTMVSHGLVAAMLFYLVGAVYQRSHTRELSDFGGLGSIAPRWSVAFVFASLASAGLPGLSGFPGEFMTLLSSVPVLGPWTLLALFGVVLAAAYNLRAVRHTVQGDAGKVAELIDLGGLETTSMALVAFLIVVLGFMPWLLTMLGDDVFGQIVALVAKGA